MGKKSEMDTINETKKKFRNSVRRKSVNENKSPRKSIKNQMVGIEILAQQRERQSIVESKIELKNLVDAPLKNELAEKQREREIEVERKNSYRNSVDRKSLKDGIEAVREKRDSINEARKSIRTLQAENLFQLEFRKKLSKEDLLM